MKSLFRFFAIILIFYACTENGENNDSEDLKITIKTNSLLCYPNDNINWNFSVNIENGLPPYTISWLNPDFGHQKDSIIVTIENNINLEFEVLDTNENYGYLNLTVLKDTIDSLKYDFRDLYVGLYIGSFKKGYPENYDIHSSNWISQEGIDTFEITKNIEFSMLSVIPSFISDLSYDSSINNFTADDIDSYGYFNYDSLFYGISTSVGYYHFKGKKVENNQ